MKYKVLAGVLTVIGAVYLAWWFCIPEPLFNSPYSTILLGRDGELLGARIAADGQWRFPAEDGVPKRFAVALVVFEDKRFYEHNGVDLAAIARAARSNIQGGRVVSGGSTLTMQIARRIRNRSQRSLIDKLIETAMAMRIEQRYSKQEILKVYAANAPFGGNVVGLEAAAWRYFGRSAHRLSWAETCTLAVLPNSPSLIHPGRNRVRLQAKRDRLLRKLHEQGVINALDLEVSLREPLPAAPLPLPQTAPHLLETLRAQTPRTYRFETTLDAHLQTTASQIVHDRATELAQQDIHNAAAIIIDNSTFEVVAYVGNARWSINNDHGLAVDIVQRPRSTGSILKPLLYAAMLESGDILPRTLIPDIPTQYSGYMPENYDHSYSGAVPADVALAQSLNVPAVRMLQQYGVSRFYDLLQHAGISTLRRKPDEYGLTLILGGAEAKLWDIAAAYANLADIASQLHATSPQPYRRISLLKTSEQTHTASPQTHPYRHVSLLTAPEQPRGTAEIGPASAWLTLNALLEVPRPGDEGHWKNFASARKIAWKTGTSWGLRDAWAIGTSAHYTVGVWVGNATGEGRPGLTGSTAAAPLLFQLFNRLDAGPWFTRPDRQMKRVETCRNDGYLANGYCDIETLWIPRQSHFSRTSPYNVPIHLDATGRYRVNDACESVMRMKHTNGFVLPPAQEFYYRRTRADYRAPPPWRSDCEATNSKAPMDFLYPNAATRVYIPIDLAAKKGRVVFEAVHRDNDAVLYWHLDQHYVATTRTFHSEALDIAPGAHVITVVDQAGNRMSRSFEVIGEPTGQSSVSRSH
jgi:penicillin-binding protein 1C